MVMLLQREDYYSCTREASQQTGAPEMIAADDRNGPAGDAKLDDLEACCRFENAACLVPLSIRPAIRVVAPARAEPAAAFTP
ncbi:MAG: hypothetical protein IH606_05455 [Burkholderiales bacterium]|nr:hypothetical protein [Burkholderiales bacterium]